jgi:hypothetical protein
LTLIKPGKGSAASLDRSAYLTSAGVGPGGAM